jgi:hypothetical protein
MLETMRAAWGTGNTTKERRSVASVCLSVVVLLALAALYLVPQVAAASGSESETSEVDFEACAARDNQDGVAKSDFHDLGAGLVLGHVAVGQAHALAFAVASPAGPSTTVAIRALLRTAPKTSPPQ